jgi:tryptophan halogenase
MKEIRINTDASIRLEKISDDHHYVVVDDFLQDPDELVEFAAQHASEFSSPDSSYPGQQFVVNDDAMKDIYRFIRFQMTRHFSFLKGNMNLYSNLSMATTHPSKLWPLQRICHIDLPSPDRTIYAALVYLFQNEELGGTDFYRYHDAELVQKAVAMQSEGPEKGLAFLQEHFPTYRKPACYMTESNEIAELICRVPARFNRLLFYSGQIPHSGAITAPELLSRDIRKGRLTLNVFADVLPK